MRFSIQALSSVDAACVRAHEAIASRSDRRAAFRLAAVVTSGLLLAACGGGDDGGSAAAPNPPPSSGNQGPTISGSPPASVMQDAQFDFAPTANDPDGDALTFTITGLPSWAAFDSASGSLTGTPGSADVGTYANIRITVSDGTATATLGPFSIDVVATASGSATLTWNPPTTRTDGSQLSDLSGYKIYWGTSQSNYTNSVTLNNPGLSSYVVDQLTSGTWWFVATAFDSSGVESQFSNAASKTIP